MALRDEIQVVEADTKARIIRAANAARDLVELEAALDEPFGLMRCPPSDCTSSAAQGRCIAP
ncbi:MAG: hypothetical protein R3F60_33370 [bacterium]